MTIKSRIVNPIVDYRFQSGAPFKQLKHSDYKQPSVMLSTEPARESPISMVTTSHYQEERGGVEDKPCHVVLKPTPQRLYGSIREPSDSRPRVVDSFSSTGTGAFSAYVPKSRRHEAAAAIRLHRHLVHSTGVEPFGVWADVRDKNDHYLTDDSERQPNFPAEYPPQEYYLIRTIKRELPHSEYNDSDENGYHSEGDKYPVDLRNNSKKFRSAEYNDAPEHLTTYSPNQDFPATEGTRHAIAHENESENFSLRSKLVAQRGGDTREQRSLLADTKNASMYNNVSPAAGTLPHYRHETVIIRNTYCQESPNKSQEGAEYMRYTVRNNTARAEVFEMKRSYAPVDDVLPHLPDVSSSNAGEIFRRGTNASPDANIPPDGFAGQSCSYDSDGDEEIDVVSDDYLQPSGNTDEEEQYMGDRSDEESESPVGNPAEESSRIARDADSDGCEARALDYRVAAGRRRRASPRCEETASPSNGFAEGENARLTSGSLTSSDAHSLATNFSSGPSREEPAQRELKTPTEATLLRCAADPQEKEASWGVFTVEDLLLRNRVLLILWSLLGEGRLLEVGYPRAPVHRVLWLTVDVCCSVAGMKSAAAVPLTSDHNCQEDMLCFRDHTHRFLEVCAPTRDMWKQFGWAGLTVDAVVRKIYEEELRPRLSKLPADKFPPVIQRALLRLDRLEEMLELPGGADMKITLPPVGTTPTKLLSVVERSSKGDAQQPSAAKKKRGRPAKANQKTDPGRIERVMLWRFLLNLLEDPRNKPCIHWVQREEGIFRILNTDWLARLWGRRHGNPRMTYEKMARAMRTYYRSKVLQPVPRTRNLPRKLIYKFNPAVIHKVSSTKYAPFSDRGLNYNTSPGGS